MRIYDISQTLQAGVPVWPGDTPYEEVRTWTIADGPVNVSRITLSTHTGAHADAPLHYDADGLPISEVGLDVYLGPCRVIDARDFGPTIEAAHLPHQCGAVERSACQRGVQHKRFAQLDANCGAGGLRDRQ